MAAVARKRKIRNTKTQINFTETINAWSSRAIQSVNDCFVSSVYILETFQINPIAVRNRKSECVWKPKNVKWPSNVKLKVMVRCVVVMKCSFCVFVLSNFRLLKGYRKEREREKKMFWRFAGSGTAGNYYRRGTVKETKREVGGKFKKKF